MPINLEKTVANWNKALKNSGLCVCRDGKLFYFQPVRDAAVQGGGMPGVNFSSAKFIVQALRLSHAAREGADAAYGENRIRFYADDLPKPGGLS